MYVLSLNVKDSQNETIELLVPVIDIIQNYFNFNVLSQILNSPEGFFLKLATNSITTITNLITINPHEIWYFNENQIFMGKAFTLSTCIGLFMFQTQAKCALVLHRNILSKLCESTAISLTFNPNSVTL